MHSNAKHISSSLNRQSIIDLEYSITNQEVWTLWKIVI